MLVLLWPNPIISNSMGFSFLVETVTPAPASGQMLASSPKYSWSSA